MDTEDAVHKDWSRMKRKVAAHRQRLDWVRSLQRAKGTSETGTVGTRGRWTSVDTGSGAPNAKNHSTVQLYGTRSRPNTLQ